MNLPVISENAQKWWNIPEQFSADMADVIFDTGVVAISWLKRLNSAIFSDVSTVVNLTKLQEILGYGSDLTHILAFPSRITGVLKADNTLKLAQSVLKLTRTVASIAKVIFDHAVILSPKGQFLAGRVKYTTWGLSGAISVGEKLYAFYDPTDEQKEYGYCILTLDLVKTIAFLSVGLLRLFDRPALRRYVLPVSTVLLVLVSVVYTAQKVVKAKNCKELIKN